VGLLDVNRVGPVLNRRPLIEQRQQPLAARETFRRALSQVVEALDRFEELREIGRQDYQRAERQPSSQHQARATGDEQRGRDGVRNSKGPLHVRGDRRFLDAGPKTVGVEPPEAVARVLFASERLDDGQTAHDFLREPCHLALAPTPFARCAAQPRPVVAHEQREPRQEHDGTHRELRLQPEHQRQRRDRGEDMLDERRDRPCLKAYELVDVSDKAKHQLAAAMRGPNRGRQLLEVRQHAIADVGVQPLAKARADRRVARLGERTHGRNRDDRAAHQKDEGARRAREVEPAQHGREASAAENVIDDDLERPWRGETGDNRDEPKHIRERDRVPVIPHDRREPSHHPAPRRTLVRGHATLLNSEYSSPINRSPSNRVRTSARPASATRRANAASRWMRSSASAVAAGSSGGTTRPVRS